MKILDGIKIIKPKIYKDKRGLFFEIWNKKNFSKLGIRNNFVQDNYSFSYNKGTFRGFHFQKPPFSQAKIVRCSRGSIIDVVIDIRRKSKTYGKYNLFRLTSNNKLQIYIPIGFLHGYLTLEDNTEVDYKVSNFYNPKFEETIIYNDKTINFNIPKRFSKITISKKDLNGISFANFKSPYYIK